MGKGKAKHDERQAGKLARLTEIARSRGLSGAGDLEETVDTSFHGYEEMSALCSRLGVRHNQVYGGYLRQPITVDDHGNWVEVYGGCVLSDGYCRYRVRPVESFSACDECPVYQTRFPATKAD